MSNTRIQKEYLDDELVTGPASAGDMAVARYDGTTGKVIQNSNTELNDDATLTLTDPDNIVYDEVPDRAAFITRHTRNGSDYSSYRIAQNSYDILQIERAGDTTGDGDDWSIIDMISPNALSSTDNAEVTYTATTRRLADGSVQYGLDWYNNDYRQDRSIGVRQQIKGTTPRAFRWDYHDKTTNGGAYVLGEIYTTATAFSFTSVNSEQTGATPEIGDWIYDNAGTIFTSDTRITNIQIGVPSAALTTFTINKALLATASPGAGRGSNIKESMRITPDRVLLVRKFIETDADNVAEFGGDILVDGNARVDDEAYGVGWDGSLEVPTKNALYDKIETLGGASPASAYYFVAANDATTKEKALADYQCDGTADEVQINAAIDAIRAIGGEVRLSSGNFAIAASINMDGNTAEAGDNPEIRLIGSGIDSTFLNGASNVDVIETGQRAKYEMAFFTIVVTGSGDGIHQTAGTERGNWQSHIHDIFVETDFTTHTGWGIDMQSPFRMRFTNVEMNGVANGINLQAHTDAFNPGNLTLDRIFIDLWDNASNSNAIGFKLACSGSAAEGVMNLVTINRMDIAGGTNLTNSIGISIVGSTSSFGDARHFSFTNLNIEDVKTAIKHVRGRDCTYRDINYTRVLSGGTVIDLDSNSHNNFFENLYAVAQGSGQTFNLIIDANGSNNLPNKLSRVDGFQPSSVTINATVATSTIIEHLDLSGGSPTIDSDITNRNNLFTVGGGTGAGTIRSRGDNDLVLQTGNSTTGTITIVDGANGNITFAPNGSGTTRVDGSLTPVTNDDGALGSTSLQFSDLFLAEGGAINWDNGDAVMTQSGNQVTLTGASFSASVVASTLAFTQAFGDVSNLGNLGASETFAWDNATNFTGTLDQNTTLNFSGAVSGQTITLYLAYDGTAQRTIGWTPTIKWGGQAAPTAPDASGEVLVITVKYVGTTYYGSYQIFS